MTLVRKLTGIITGCVLVTSIGVGVASYMVAYQDLRKKSEQELHALQQDRQDAIERYLTSLKEDLIAQSQSPFIARSIIDFQKAWQKIPASSPGQALQTAYIDQNPHAIGEKHNLNRAPAKNAYNTLHGRYHPYFRTWLSQHGYYDLFLFDRTGNVVYTVFKERDFATNVLSGQWKNTELARVYKAAMKAKTGKIAFVDFKPYAPSNNVPASFIASPVKDSRGKVVGVMAFQLPIDRLNNVMNEVSRFGETAQAYLVGRDGLLRNDLRFAKKSTILSLTAKNKAVEQALKGKHGVLTLQNPLGKEVLAAYGQATFEGVSFAIIAEKQLSEILAISQHVLYSTLKITLLISLLLSLLAWRVAHRFSKPILRLTSNLSHIAEGDASVVIDGSERKDELGAMARAAIALRDVSLEAFRLKTALHYASANVMMLDTTGKILYLNHRANELFTCRQQEVAQGIAGFRSENILQSNIAIFSPFRTQGADTTSSASYALGGCTFDVTFSPIQHQDGSCLGTIAEWVDSTAQLAIEEEIAQVVLKTTEGDLSASVTMEGKTGFFRQLGDGINAITGTTRACAQDVQLVLSAIAKGDLRPRITNHYQGIFQELKDSTNATANTLSDVLRKISGMSTVVSSAAGEMASGSDDLSQRTEQQAAAVEETSASINELLQSIKQNMENAEAANSRVQEASTSAQESADIAAKAIEAMERIRHSSQQITDIISVMDSLAFQTNLLALNAAVEAARAGDAGKGFAVVASEVRSLAQRSAQSSNDIKKLIADSSRYVAEGVNVVHTSSDTMLAISTHINTIRQMVSDISQNSIEQTNGVEQVSTAMASIDESTQQNAALAEQTTASVHELTQQVKELQALVGQFQLAKAG
jgi:methyl-accepting chemotaxis protein